MPLSLRLEVVDCDAVGETLGDDVAVRVPLELPVDDGDADADCVGELL